MLMPRLSGSGAPVAKKGVSMPATRLIRKRRRKPTKPYASFPLTPRNNGQWCKKVRGKVHFFGVWEDPDAALQRYLQLAADLHAGREPHHSVSADGPTGKEVCNRWVMRQLRALGSSSWWHALAAVRVGMLRGVRHHAQATAPGHATPQ